MDEEKKLNEQELDKVAGGGRDPGPTYEPAFEQDWADFERNYCGRCRLLGSGGVACCYLAPTCRQNAHGAWVHGEPIQCPNFTSR